MTQTMPDPLVVYTDTALCTGQHEHEVVVVTEGQHAYAWTLGRSGTDVPAVARDGVRLTTTCPQPVGSGGDERPCGGDVEWTLDTPGCWGQDRDLARMLRAYGSTVEQ